MTQLTKNFALSEFVASSTAQAQGIDNTPTSDVVENLTYLAQTLLQPLRDWLGEPLYVSSGYRCPALNKAVGGASTSYHLIGCAADVQLGVNTKWTYKEVFKYVAENLPYSELIAEGIPLGWLHLAIQKGKEDVKDIKYMLNSDHIVRRATLDTILEKYDLYS